MAQEQRGAHTGGEHLDDPNIDDASVPTPSEYFSTRVETMKQQKRKFATALEFEIEASKIHWSEVNHPASTKKHGNERMGVEEGAIQLVEELSEVDKSNVAKTDLEIFESLRQQYGDFFNPKCEYLVGRKIAEGGQAEIFNLLHQNEDGTTRESLRVLKVMKEGYSLHNLQKQWPPTMLHQIQCNSDDPVLTCSIYGARIYGARLLRNGRFAFQMHRYWGDLRKNIDLRIQSNVNQGPPFTYDMAVEIIKEIAIGMRRLHKDNIIHRDLKAANVLLEPLCSDFNPMTDKFHCQVAD